MTTENAVATDPRIVVAVDGSDSAAQALRWAAFIAAPLKAHIEAVIAWEPLGYASWGTAGWAAFPEDWNPEANATQVVNDSLDKVFGPGNHPAGLTISAREGSAAKVILAASESATMLVMGSRGHGGFAGLLLGSVSTACTEHATCPVLVIHGDTPLPPLG
jgi:nucleotide-binding universal stress UspA family protein